MLPGSYLYCGDCHNNNQNRNFGGTGTNGPHGSSWLHLLERRYELDFPPSTPGGATAGPGYLPGSNGTYAICDKCHDIANSILQDVTFKKHTLHVVTANTSCSTCHSSHGIQGGNASNNKSLVNFDTRIVGPDINGQLSFTSLGTNAGRCFLTCHGKNHSGLSY